MRIAMTLLSLITLAACASGPETSSDKGALGKVQERRIVSSTMERSASRPQVPIRERSMSSQPFQESVLRPVYEHVVTLSDGRTVRVQGASAAHPPGSCVRVLEADGNARLAAADGCGP